MPANKSALLRYRIIDSCLTNSMRKYPTMEFIIDKIEVQLGKSISNSMFTKDIDAMKREHSAPIEYNRANKGYCYTEPDYSFSTFPLSADEIEALDFSTALLQQLKHTSLFANFEAAINRFIEGYRISKVLGKSEKQLLQVEESVSSEGSNWIEIILKGITEMNCLEVIYHPYGRAEKAHLFSPYLLKEYRNRWYTIGYSNIAENILVLALDRIQRIEKTTELYISNASFSPEEFFKYSFGITQIHDAVAEKVELLFTPVQSQYIISQPLHHSQTILSNDEAGLRIQLEVYLTRELSMCILSYAENVTVIKPKKLINQIRQHVENMRGLYN